MCSFAMQEYVYIEMNEQSIKENKKKTKNEQNFALRCYTSY